VRFVPTDNRVECVRCRGDRGPGEVPGVERVEVTGVPTRIEKGSTFRQTTPTRLGPKATATFQVEKFDQDLREIRLRCQSSGFYSHWLLTEARADTFAEVEVGIEPHGFKKRVVSLPMTRTYLRRAADVSLDGLRRVLRRG
jgi:hypothetical protein